MSLRDLVTDLAARPELWRSHVRHGPQRRVFAELDLDVPASVWLICWMPGHDTGFHDHDGSGGAVAVLQGSVREERLRLGGPPASALVPAGGVFTFEGYDIHRVTHAGFGPAVTLHAYAPKLTRMGQYELEPDGTLRRHALDEGTELQPRVSEIVLS